MATVYSLVCWGGKDGKSVTVSSSTDLVTLTNHGLRNGKGVQFASGTLPTVAGAALALNTTYFAKWISTSTFELYYDSSLTTKIDFTSIGSSLVMKGAYYQGLTDTSRWGTRIYDGIVSWHAARVSAATTLDAEYLELGDAFDDIKIGGSFTHSLISPATTITASINGIRTAACHGGLRGEGYRFLNGTGSVFISSRPYVLLDGFSIVNTGASNSVYGAFVASPAGGIEKMIFDSNGYATAIYTQSVLTKVVENLIVGWWRGLMIQTYTYGALYANNTIVGNTTGVYPQSSTTVYGYYYNNAVYGNTTNWATATPTYVEGASKNTGEAADANNPWTAGAGATSIDITSADFVNYAGGDFRPASASSLLTDAGTDYYGRLGFDIADDEVPNYNNGGAEGVDIGCFEFDHGYGPHPSAHTLTLTNVVVGSRILVRDQANTTTHYDQIASSSTVVVAVTVYGDARDNWKVKIRKASAAPYYQSFETLMTAAAGASSIYVNQLAN